MEFDANACDSSVKTNGRAVISFEQPFLALDYKEYYNKKANHIYTKGCKWAPDGSCLLVASDDRELNIFNLPPNIVYGEFHDEKWITEGWKKDSLPVLTVTENEDLYDYCWYPLMRSNDPKTCCFAVTCRNQPIHLWDAWTGKLICSYLAYNHLDEMIPAYSLSISVDGLHLISGYNKSTRVYDISKPGRECTTITCNKQGGIISCLSFHPEIQHIYASGSYEGSIGLFSLKYKKEFAVFKGHTHGITQIQFSSDGTKLFSGTRKDDEILCWDIRNPGMMLGTLKRKLTTNQKMYFDLTPQDQHLLSGTQDGQVMIWDLNSCLSTIGSNDPIDSLPTTSFKAHLDCVNGVSFHPFSPILATSSGQRHISKAQNDDDDGSDSDLEERSHIENTVKLWWLS